MLSTRHIKSKRPTKKLDQKFYGPHKIKAKVSTHAYRLDLPRTMRIHNVFHVASLEPYKPNTLANRDQPPPPAEIVDGEIEYEVEASLDCVQDKRRKDQVAYRVKYLGYDDPTEDRWMSTTELAHCKDLIKDFHKKNPSKPRPVTR